MISRIAAAFALLVALSSAAQNEVPLGDPPRYQPQYAYAASVASDGENFFAVWRDERYGTVARGTLITRRGEVRNPFGLIFGSNSSLPPRVVWSGTSYLVFWSPYEAPTKVFLARFSRDGVLIDSPRVVIEKGVSTSVATDGTRVVVGYARPGTDLRALLLDSNAKVIADVVLDGQYYEDAVFAPHGDGFAAAWSSWNSAHISSSVMVAQITGDGRVTRKLSLGPGRNPSIVSGGNEVLVVSNPSTTNDTPMLFRVSGDVSSVILATRLPANQWITKTFWRGDHYVLIGGETTTKRLAITRVSANGGSVDPSIGPADRFADDAAMNGNEILVTFGSQSIGGSHAVLISESGAEVWPPKPLALGAANQRDPSLVHGGGITLALWRETSGLYAMRIAANGTLIDGAGVLVSRDASRQRAVFDGTNFVIAYITNESQFGFFFTKGTLKARFLSPVDGLLPDEQTITDRLRVNHYALAAGRDATLVVWSPVDDTRLWATRINGATRTLLGPEVPVSGALDGDSQFAGTPAAAWNGSDYLVAWDQRVCTWFHLYECKPSASYATRLSADLLLRDPSPLTFDQPDGVVGVASDGSDWLIAWPSAARRVFADGTFTPAAFIYRARSLDWNGTEYVIVAKWLTQDVLERIPRNGPITATVIATITGTGSTVIPAGPDRFAIAEIRRGSEEKYGSTQRGFVRFIDLLPKRRSVR